MTKANPTSRTSPELWNCALSLFVLFGSGMAWANCFELEQRMRYREISKSYRNFFFNEETFHKANSILAKLKDRETLDPVLIGLIYQSGFDIVVTIRLEPEYPGVLPKESATGRITRLKIGNQRDDEGRLTDEIIVEEITLFGARGLETIKTPRDLIKRADITFEHLPFKLPSHVNQQGPLSAFAGRLGITGLRRGASLEELKAVLINKELRPSDRFANDLIYTSFAKASDYTYFNGWKPPPDQLFKRAVYKLKAELLDRQDFWINPSWDHGVFHRASLRWDHPDVRRALYLYKEGIWGDSPEIVFASPISIGNLEKMLVLKGQKERTVRYLQEGTNLSTDYLSRLIEETY